MTQSKSVKMSPPQYGKGDFRKVLMVLAAVQNLQDDDQGASLLRLVDATGLDKKTVFSSLRLATMQAGVHVEQVKACYRIVDWGPLLLPQGAALALKGKLDGRFIQDGSVVPEPIPPRPKVDEAKPGRKK
ncbi:hypothetical protein PWP93_36345 [Paraburkholderia sp. A1RI-2L]|uniref:hypothetical protein n=1 Tax=Paraburkholderia sp. A1RI-2L TaxID=3028367 RepID=UPI003B827C00